MEFRHDYDIWQDLMRRRTKSLFWCSLASRQINDFEVIPQFPGLVLELLFGLILRHVLRLHLTGSCSSEASLGSPLGIWSQTIQCHENVGCFLDNFRKTNLEKNVILFRNF